MFGVGGMSGGSFRSRRWRRWGCVGCRGIGGAGGLMPFAAAAGQRCRRCGCGCSRRRRRQAGKRSTLLRCGCWAVKTMIVRGEFVSDEIEIEMIEKRFEGQCKASYRSSSPNTGCGFPLEPLFSFSVFIFLPPLLREKDAPN